MAAIVVGDVDPDDMEKQIAARFSDLKNPEGARPRDDVPVPILDKTRAAVLTDPEAGYSDAEWAIKGPRTPVVTERDHRAKLVEDLFHAMRGPSRSTSRRRWDGPSMSSRSLPLPSPGRSTHHWRP
jgi:zinc protease